MIGGSTMEMEIYQTRSDLYFLLRGRVVLEECDRLKTQCLPLINKGLDQVVVDLAKVDYIDSAGLGVLVGFKMTASKNKARIVLLQPSRSVSDILYISKLDGIFDILTGAEADVLKSQIVLEENRYSRTPAVPASAPSERPENISVDTSAHGPEAQKGGKDSAGSPTVSEKLEEHCRRAVEFMRQGNYDLSVEEYRKALEIDPDYLPALNNLAIVYEKQPSWIPRAIEQWEKVLSLSQARGDQKHMDRAQRHLSSLRRMQG